MMNFLQELDERILLAVNSFHSGFFDSIMWWVSGKFSWWPLYLAIIFALFYFRKWKPALVIFLLTVVLVTISDQTSVHFFKNVFQRLRPSRNPELEGLLHLVNGYRGGKFGFISSHASNSFAVAAFLHFIFRRKWISLILFLWATLVSYSRMYLGVHYFFDVLAGAAWGFLLGLGMYYLWISFVQDKFREG